MSALVTFCKALHLFLIPVVFLFSGSRVSMLVALAIAAANIASFAGIGSQHSFLPSCPPSFLPIPRLVLRYIGRNQHVADCVSQRSIMIKILSEMDLKLNLWFHFVFFNYLVRGNGLYLGVSSCSQC